ncbi:MAG: hypothetical protein PHX60_00170 [Giesbergeria sp.]|uniref:hypothetical protein n=1 Tax=Giesbergeria sp. TaxID=2818473 RepID=UPI0026380343|nr:hypothetical protein [Giesbergeria sp.]MDD2608097.1 hypothetical protein [Giesbergeria sp.]
MRANLLPHQPEYHAWLGELKTRFRQVQLKAAVVVNSALREAAIAKQPVAQMLSIPWGHHLAIF